MPGTILQQNVTYNRMFMMVASADHITPKTGANPVVTISKAGGSFASPVGIVAEVANGWYKIGLAAADVNTIGDLAYTITGTAADPVINMVDQVTNGLQITSNVKRNASNTVVFIMTDSVNHQLKTGLSITAKRSSDAGAFVTCSNAVVEIGNGFYAVTLLPAETNCSVIGLLFTAGGADSTAITYMTQP